MNHMYSSGSCLGWLAKGKARCMSTVQGHHELFCFVYVRWIMAFIASAKTILVLLPVLTFVFLFELYYEPQIPGNTTAILWFEYLSPPKLMEFNCCSTNYNSIIRWDISKIIKLSGLNPHGDNTSVLTKQARPFCLLARVFLPSDGIARRPLPDTASLPWTPQPP